MAGEEGLDTPARSKWTSHFREAKLGKLELPQAILAPLMPAGIRAHETLKHENKTY